MKKQLMIRLVIGEGLMEMTLSLRCRAFVFWRKDSEKIIEQKRTKKILIIQTQIRTRSNEWNLKISMFRKIVWKVKVEQSSKFRIFEGEGFESLFSSERERVNERVFRGEIA